MAQVFSNGVRYIVEGGHRLSGEIEPAGNKNAALPIVAAALLTDQKVTLTNVPRIRDVEALVELVRTLGAHAEWTALNTLEIEAKKVRPAALDPELCARIRASILLAGPLLARAGKVTLPPPGGDVIGRRRVDTHSGISLWPGRAEADASAQPHGPFCGGCHERAGGRTHCLQDRTR